MIGMREEVLDPIVVEELLAVADDYQSDPDQRVTGAAVDSLRLLVTVTEQWYKLLTKYLDAGESIPADQLKPGVPTNLSEAEALHQRACAAIKAVLEIRREQRHKARSHGGPFFTAGDYDAIRLWRRVQAFLTPLPAAIAARLASNNPANSSTTADPTQAPPAKTRTKTVQLRNGRRIQKQLRHRPQPASVA